MKLVNAGGDVPPARLGRSETGQREGDGDGRAETDRADDREERRGECARDDGDRPPDAAPDQLVPVRSHDEQCRSGGPADMLEAEEIADRCGTRAGQTK